MTDLAINMAPVMGGMVLNVLGYIVRVFVAIMLGTWAIFWARFIYRMVSRK